MTILNDRLDVLMSEKVKAVEIRAELRQIKTMADGTANITINVPEDCREQVKVMLDWHHLEIRAVLALNE
jgi:hypothetical protein